MSEWWTYRLSSFLMFSPQTYGRLVESYNRELWPGPLLSLAAGLLAMALALRGDEWASRALAALLAMAWAWVAWAFLLQRYATVFLAAPHLAAASALQSALFLVIACAPAATGRRSAGGPGRRVGILIGAAGLVGYPLLAPALGRSWRQAEVFGWMPDPTALATLGLILASHLQLPRGPRWLLLLLPAVVLLFGGATQWALWERG